MRFRPASMGSVEEWQKGCATGHEFVEEHEHDMLFRREEIAARVAEIGAQISHDFAGEAFCWSAC